jgi:hypothetical protein
MKKLLLVGFVLLCTLLSFSQIQRISLFEEFTGECCGPCAQQNPSITKLVLANQSPARKVLLLRYMGTYGAVPGAGSLYQDNPTEVASRASYYSVPFGPYGRLNGIVLPPDGHAGDLSQKIIDSAYAVNAPFSIAANHVLNNAADSIFVTIKSTAVQAFNPTGVLKLQCALIEEYIQFDKPPGTNGEKEFEFTMRKMLPSASGTTMTAGAWTNGQIQTIVLKAKIPTYIKDKTQIAIVAFIQDDGNKKIMNAAYSEVVPLPVVDTYVKDVTNGVVGCVSSISPVVTIKNSGAPTITSAVIDYSVDGGSIQTYNFSGNLASGTFANVSLPSVNITNPGTHSITATVKLPNGQADVNTKFDTKTTTFFNYANAVPAPFNESFTQTKFPPKESWLINDANHYGYPWKHSGATYPTLSGSASGGGAAWIHAAWVQMKGVVNEIALPLMNLGNAPTMTFYFAAAEMTGNISVPQEKFEVLASNDCGLTWKVLLSRVGAAYYTHAANSDFVPKVASDWRKETVSLSPVQNSNEVIIKFVATSAGFGTNNIFLDDINIDNTVGVQTQAEGSSKVNVFPNPAIDDVYLTTNLLSTQDVYVSVMDFLGKVVFTSSYKGVQGANQFLLNTSALSSGVYSVEIKTIKDVQKVRMAIRK